MTFGELYYCSDRNCYFNLYLTNSDGLSALLWSNMNDVGKPKTPDYVERAVENEFSNRVVSRFRVTPINNVQCLIEAYVKSEEE